MESNAGIGTLSNESESTFRNYALLVHGLYILSIFFFLPALVGVVIAYLKRGEAKDSIYHSHFVYAIRTFWMMIILSFVAGLMLVASVFILPLVLLVILVIPVFIWSMIRLIKPMMKALERKPIANPTAWV